MRWSFSSVLLLMVSRNCGSALWALFLVVLAQKKHLPGDGAMQLTY